MGLNNAMNVTTGKPKLSGAIFTAPLGTQLPTDAETALSDAFTCLGYVSEDGLENSNDLTVESIKAWGGVIVYRSLTEFADDFKFALIESESIDAKKAAYGDANVSIASNGNIHVKVNNSEPQERVWVFELALRGNKKHRIVVSDGAVTGRDAITYNDTDAVAYALTVSAYPDANGDTHEEWTSGDTPSI